MAKESLLQILAIDLFVKGTYHVVKILHNITDLEQFLLSLKENLVFAKLFQITPGSNIIA